MVFYFQDRDKNEIQIGSSTLFEELTGAKWTEKMHLPRDLSSIAYSVSISDRELMQLVLPSYKAFLKSPPKVFIKLGPCKGKHSVHALENIPKGTTLLEYVGQWQPRGERSSYRWGPIDALHYRSYSSLVEDGFPNLGAFYLYDVDGSPLRILFIALEEIAAGQVLTVHYGTNHSVKLSYHKEYRIDQMRQFFQKTSLEKVVRRIKDLRSRGPRELGWRRTLELEGLVNKLRYLYQTPGALLSLLLTGDLQQKEIFCHYSQADFRYFFVGFSLTPNKREQAIISALDLLKEIFAQGEISIDPWALELLDNVRHQTIFLTYLKLIVRGKCHEVAKQETLIHNDALDALDRCDRCFIESIFERSIESDQLIANCISYARDQNSPLLSWLESLVAPSPLLPQAS